MISQIIADRGLGPNIPAQKNHLNGIIIVAKQLAIEVACSANDLIWLVLRNKYIGQQTDFWFINT